MSVRIYIIQVIRKGIFDLMTILKTTAPNKGRIHISGKHVGCFQELTIECELQKGMNFCSGM